MLIFQWNVTKKNHTIERKMQEHKIFGERKLQSLDYISVALYQLSFRAEGSTFSVNGDTECN